MTVGECIRRYRKKRGLTQKKLGELSNTSETTIKQYETGKRQPRLEQLSQIANALGVSLADLAQQDTTENISIDIDHVPFVRDGVISPSILNVREKIDSFEKAPFSSLTEKERWDVYYNSLNDPGRDKAFELIELLLAIPKYRNTPCNIDFDAPTGEIPEDSQSK